MTVDNRELGRLQGQLLRCLLPGGGNVLYLEGPSMAPATIGRRQGLQRELHGSHVEIAKSLTGDWNESSGEKAVSFWLRPGGGAIRPDLIGSQNDLMAVGARKAIAAQKPEWSSIPIIGCDGLPEGGQRLVREGVLTATVVQPSTAGPAVEFVARALRGEAVPPITLLGAHTYPALANLGSWRH